MTTTIPPKSVKLKIFPRFPSLVSGRIGINVDKVNGNYFLDLDYAEFSPVSSLPAANLYTLVWNADANQYILTPLGVFAYVEAPNDTSTYGRHALSWVPVLPLSGGTLTGPVIAGADPVNPLGLATKQYVDSHSSVSGIIPEQRETSNYTTVLADAGKFIYHPTSDNNARTFTIDSNVNVPYSTGTVISFVNMINTVTIAITSDTLTLAGSGATGSRTLAANGCCTALKIEPTAWIISGTGLT
jgi:hypothetical protein